MAGTWKAQNKVRPGAYINVKGNGQPQFTSALGRLLFIPSDSFGWGKSGVIPLTSTSDFRKYIGVDSLDDLSSGSYTVAQKKDLLFLREALKGAETVLYLNAASGTAASLNDVEKYSKTPYGEKAWQIAAKYPGERGNSINMSFDPMPDANGEIKQIKVTTLWNTSVVDEQVVDINHLDNLKSNDYIDVITKNSSFGSEVPKDKIVSLNVSLTGGTTKASDNLMNVLTNALENENYTVVSAYDLNVTPVLEKIVKRMREDEGKRIRAVVPYQDGQNYNYEGVSVVANGYKLSDGEVITPEVATARFAGLSCSADADTALTYTELDDAVQAYPQLDNEQTIEALNQGKVVYTSKPGQRVVIEWDINSFTKFSPDKQKEFHKNRVVRTIDEIYTNTQETFEQSFLGKVSNNENGRDLFKANRVTYLTDLQNRNIIQDFKPEDITVSKGIDSDAVVVDLYVTPVDSMEKLYVTMTVR